jgi:hypothetical protein
MTAAVAAARGVRSTGLAGPADASRAVSPIRERRVEPDARSNGRVAAGERRIERDVRSNGLVEAGERRIEGDAAAVRRSARRLHAACAELLPGYADASREPWRQALLTAGCLDGPPVRPAPRRPSPPLIVEDVVQPSDVLCALWLARRSGLFCAGSACGDGVGRRSACEIVPAFAPDVSERLRDEVWEVLRANTAWRAHRAARMAA